MKPLDANINLGQIYTKPFVAQYMAQLFTLKENSRILDPCFGGGVFIDSLCSIGKYKIYGVELDKLSCLQYHCSNENVVLENKDFFSLPDNPNFDGIIMNPPYVRQEEIDNLSAYGVCKKELRKLCRPFHLPSKANFYLYFLAYSIKQLHEGGQIVVIFPDTWMKTPEGKTFFDEVLDTCSIEQHLHCVGNPFVGNPLVDVSIIKFVKTAGISTTHKKIFILDEKIEEKRYIEDCSISSNNICKLKTVAKIRRGLSTGYNKAFINVNEVSEEYKKDIISSPKSICGYNTDKAQKDTVLLINDNTVISSDLRKYLSIQESIIKKNRKPQTLYALIKEGKPWYIIKDAFYGELIFPYIIRECTRFVMNSSSAIIRDNFYVIKSETNPYLLFALLNNWHIYYQLELAGKNYGKGLLKIQKYDIDDLNIINPTLLKPQDKRKLIQYAKILIGKGQETTISKISDILSDYYCNFEISSIYHEKKNRRLNKF